MKIVETNTFRSHGKVNKDDDMVRAVVDMRRDELSIFKSVLANIDKLNQAIAKAETA